MDEKKLDEKKLEAVTGGFVPEKDDPMQGEALLERCRLICEGCPAAHKNCPLHDDIEQIKSLCLAMGHCAYRVSFETPGG